MSSLTTAKPPHTHTYVREIEVGECFIKQGKKDTRNVFVLFIGPDLKRGGNHEKHANSHCWQFIVLHSQPGYTISIKCMCASWMQSVYFGFSLFPYIFLLSSSEFYVRCVCVCVRVFSYLFALFQSTFYSCCLDIATEFMPAIYFEYL